MLKKFKEQKWSDPFRWKMDIVKSAITYCCVALSTILLFMFFVDRKQFQWQSEYGLKMEALKNYERHCGLYTLWAYDAFRDACYCKSDSSASIVKWQNEGYDELKVAHES